MNSSLSGCPTGAHMLADEIKSRVILLLFMGQLGFKYV